MIAPMLADNRDLDLIIQNPPDQPLDAILHQSDLWARRYGHQPRHGLYEQGCRDRRRKSYAKPLVAPPLCGLNVDILRLVSHPPEHRQDDPSKVGELKQFSLSIEQLVAQLTLELSNSFSHCSLSNATLLGGFCEAQRACDRKKEPNFEEFHTISKISSYRH